MCNRLVGFINPEREALRLVYTTNIGQEKESDIVKEEVRILWTGKQFEFTHDLFIGGLGSIEQMQFQRQSVELFEMDLLNCWSWSWVFYVQHIFQSLFKSLPFYNNTQHIYIGTKAFYKEIRTEWLPQTNRICWEITCTKTI